MKRILVLSIVASSALAGADTLPPQIAELAKATTGTWTCTGTANHAGQMLDSKSTMTVKLDLDGAWIVAAHAAKAGTISSKGETETTYDGAQKKWFRLSRNSEGAHAVLWGAADGKKITWEGEGYFFGHTVKLRGVDELTSPKEQHQVWEFSSDDGKSWHLDHDVTCKKP